MNNETINRPSVRSKRRIGCLIFVILVPLFLFTWCRFTPLNRFPGEAIAALLNDPNAIFYSIEPESFSEDATTGFRGYPIAGQTLLSTAGERKLIVQELTCATRGAWDRAACFDPRHAFRASSTEGTFDILVCFQCGMAYVYFPDGRLELVLITGSPDKLNAFLKDRHVPLPVH